MDAALLSAARGGDETAFLALYHRHSGRVRRLVERWVSDPDLVDDLCQESWLRAFRGLDRFRGEADFGSWLHTIARNVVTGLGRSNQRRTELMEMWWQPRDRSEPPPVELRLELDRAVATLPPGMRRSSGCTTWKGGPTPTSASSSASRRARPRASSSGPGPGSGRPSARIRRPPSTEPMPPSEGLDSTPRTPAAATAPPRFSSLSDDLPYTSSVVTAVSTAIAGDGPVIEYRGYTATVSYDPANGTFVGVLDHIPDRVTFRGGSVEELQSDMARAVDAYIDFCLEWGREAKAVPYIPDLTVHVSRRLEAMLSRAGALTP